MVPAFALLGFQHSSHTNPNSTTIITHKKIALLVNGVEELAHVKQ